MTPKRDLRTERPIRYEKPSRRWAYKPCGRMKHRSGRALFCRKPRNHKGEHAYS